MQGAEVSAVLADLDFLIVVLVLTGMDLDTFVVRTFATITPSFTGWFLSAISSSELLPSGRGSWVLVIVYPPRSDPLIRPV